MTDTKPINIIGAGAIGKALAGILTRYGRAVTLVRASVDEKQPGYELITVHTANQETIQATVPLRTIREIEQFDGIVVLTNKSYGNKRVASLLEGRIGHSPVVLLQNGLGVENVFDEQYFPVLYRCVLFATSQVGDGSTIVFKPVSQSPIGIIRGSKKELEQIVNLLDNPEFPFRGEEGIEAITWKKAIVNCVFNSVCPLLEIDNGIFHRDARVMSLAEKMIGECLEIAALKGVTLSRDETVQSLLKISRSSDGQLISTLQDIRYKRNTEIDTLNGEIARLAEALGKSEDIQLTRTLGELTKLKSEFTRGI
jgi:2-dehydropantoate 2-reductase